MLLTGAQVVAWLEKSAEVFNTIDPQSADEQWLVNEDVPGYSFDVIDGISYEIDVTKPPLRSGTGDKNPTAGRIRNVIYQGRPLDPAQKFLVVTNNYRAGGGGHFPALDGSTIVIDAPDKNRDVIAAYFLDLKTFNPSADQNWKIAATTGDAAVYFRTSPGARPYASDHVRFINVMEDGFARFRLHP